MPGCHFYGGNSRHCLVPDDMLVIGSNANGVGALSGLNTDITFVVANGDVSADSIAGDIDINVTNGNIVLFDTYGDVDAFVTNGSISMGNLSFTDIISTNMQFSGRLGSGDGQISLHLTNGIITVTGR